LALIKLLITARKGADLMSQDIFTRDNLLRVENPNILVGESPVNTGLRRYTLMVSWKKRRMLMKKRRAMEFLCTPLYLATMRKNYLLLQFY